VSNSGARYQRGTLKPVGDYWVLRLRQDETGGDGKTIRREKSYRVARRSEVRTEGHARDLADALADKLSGRGLTAGVSMLAADYLRRYMAEHLITKKPSSQKTIKARIGQHLLPGVGRLRIEQVTNRTAQTIVTTMLAKGLHSTTVRDTVALLCTIMKKARDDGLACVPIEKRSVSLPAKVEADVERKTFTQAEFVRLVAHAPMPWKLAYALQGTLGLRCAEVLGLAWRDLQGDTVHIRRSVVFGNLQSLKSKCSAKPMSLPAELKPLLDEHRATWTPNDDELLFTKHGKPVHGGDYRYQLHKDLKALGIPKRGTHAFRHFVATHLLRSGKGLSATRDHMRHSSAAMTNVYAHAMSGDLQDAADCMGGLITESASHAA
jgi:integrase